MDVLDRLYVSPVRPPTPQDKSITPDEWLKAGENENQRKSTIPSLDDVKKQLLCYAMDLELNTSSSKQQSTNYFSRAVNFILISTELFWYTGRK